MSRNVVGREVQINSRINQNQNLIGIFNAALAAVDPYNAVRRAVKIEGAVLHVAGAAYDLDTFSRIVVVGAGKATARMAMAIEDVIGNRISDGLVIVKQGHTALLRTIKQATLANSRPGRKLSPAQQQAALQQTAGHRRIADSTEQDRVVTPEFLQRGVIEHEAVAQVA